ncbi:aminotransferase class I/II-fold pyridoxal phosphate-dependent enzyme [Streptomyces sp. RLA2-12]|uniref:aminotransferase class I/II-fold pyridoxal phosphate-dependent enzyme n=1 Tax=Streptomyces sp. RLA2-12 TaxID=2721242 RepID=UPI00145E1C71|nr:aminotransferase class I/II-fold pyridoxal phosphate-dependent enzyme [Streptomyces sp. RLA2-12]NMI62665.1 aminotransferase class I/II-fold pyridoxal phosphate-dependent enzyme [Streptomyces sp. RLA2-12]
MQERSTGLPARWRLSTNENEFGPAPSAVEAMAAAAQDAHRYPDCAHHSLRRSLARLHGVSEEAILVATGIDGLLAQVCRSLLHPDSPVVTTAGTYPTFAHFAEAAGAVVHTVDYHQDRADAEALATAARRHRAALVYLAEPDNPLGSALGADEVLRLADRLPESTVLVVDGAYAEYAATRPLDARDVMGRPLLWLRTFSKAHGLAGLRVGYCLYDRATTAGLDRGLEHYAVGRLAETAARADDRDGALDRGRPHALPGGTGGAGLPAPAVRDELRDLPDPGRPPPHRRGDERHATAGDVHPAGADPRAAGPGTPHGRAAGPTRRGARPVARPSLNVPPPRPCTRGCGM